MNYNTVYFSFKRRLLLVKLMVDSLSLNKTTKDRIKAETNELLILLDERYDSGRILDPLEADISKLEMSIRERG